VAHGLIKDADLTDWTQPSVVLGGLDPVGPPPPMWDQEGVHEIYRAWRQILESYGTPDRILCAEAWVEPQERAVAYVRPDEMHQAFNFDFLTASWIADDLRTVITSSLHAADSVGAPSTWVLSNHDVVRHASRLGYAPGTPRMNGISATDPQPDEALGLRRARAATVLMLALPGAAYLYQGEELGLPEHTTLPDADRQDPTWLRSGHTVRGRDGCRVPIPWRPGGPSYGFGPGERSWLPQPPKWDRYALDGQRGVAGSTYELYREALRLRRAESLGAGTLSWVDGYGDDVVSFRNGRVLVVANRGDEPVELPAGAQVLLASDGLDGGRLPADQAVWLRSR